MAKSSTRIIIAGDVFPFSKNVQLFREGKIETLFGERICNLFKDADFSICNIEGALTNSSERSEKTGPVKKASTDAVNAYKELGIKCCMLANNHATDAGHQGMLDTMKTLDEAGIDYIGAGKNKDSIIKHAIYELGGMKICFYNVSETMYNKPTDTLSGAWLYDEYVVCHDIEDLSKICDYLIVIYHGGVERFPYPSPETKKRFHRMADSGANMILSQHTHCIGSEENYNGSYLLYGQGDLLLRNYATGCTDTGLIVEISIADGKITINKHKVETVDKKSYNNTCVRYAEDQDLTAFYERSSHINDDEYIFQQFQEFCREELHLYLKAFKSPNRLMLKMEQYFPSLFNKWLFKRAFFKRDIMFALHTLRSEQNRETAIRGIEDLLKEWKD